MKGKNYAKGVFKPGLDLEDTIPQVIGEKPQIIMREKTEDEELKEKKKAEEEKKKKEEDNKNEINIKDEGKKVK